MTALPIIVHKYGGSSLRDQAALRAVAQQMVARAQAGCRLVVVVSAMGATTDALLEQARVLTAAPPERELDMLLTAGERICMALLCMAVAEAGGHAVSLTGSQSGIITENAHQGARVVAIRPGRILEVLNRGHIAVVAGYQGVSLNQEITTLGRGGSDTTAVALGAVLQAEAVELYSDVDGVYDADPRVCPQARHLPQVGYALMGDMAHFGARVLHDQAVAFAARAGIQIVARATANPQGRASRLGPPVRLPEARFAVTGVFSALWLEEPSGALTLWSAWPKLRGLGLQVVAQGGSQALCRWQVTSASRAPFAVGTGSETDAHDGTGAARLQQHLGPQVICRAVDAVTLVADGPIEEHVPAVQAALVAADVPVQATWSGARTLTLAVPEGLGRRTIRVLHAVVPP